VIATTSSEEKGKKLKALGADHVINYKTQPNWGEISRSLTRDNVGVDHIIEVGGSGTLDQSFKCMKFEGVISIIGFLGGMDPKTIPNVLQTLSIICTVRGVYVGSTTYREITTTSTSYIGLVHPRRLYINALYISL
jgi:NADPH:quinone reductase-like Zn-dependent oxidoreductase